MKTRKIILLLLILVINIIIAKAQWSEVTGLIVSQSDNINYVNNNKIWVTSDLSNNGNKIFELDSLFNRTREINLSQYNVSNIRKVFPSNNDTVFLQAYFKYGSIFKYGLLATYDGGYTFTKDFFFNTVDFTPGGVNLFFFNSQTGYFVKDTIDEQCLLTYQTYDAGKTWERRSGCDYLKYKYKTGKLGPLGETFRSNGTAIGIFYNNTYDTNYIAYTYNYGKTWQDRLLGPTKFGRITTRNAARFILHKRESPILAYTTDSGNTFQTFQRDELITNITFCENNNGNGFYIMTTKNGTFVNYNEDNNWKKIDNEDFRFSFFNSSTNGYAAKDINNGIEYQIYNYANENNVRTENLLQNNTISIYPNPATTKLTITSETAIKEIYIYDVLGKLVKQVNLENTNTKSNEIAIDELSVGIYIIQVVDVFDAKLSSKFIKE